MPSGYPTDKKTLRYIIENYAESFNEDLTRDTGLALSTLHRIARKYHLTKSTEHRSKASRISGLASAKARGGKGVKMTPEVIARRTASWQKTRKTEKARVLFGLEQQTKMKLQREPIAKRRQRSHLKKRGYVISESEYTAYYTPSTLRSPLLESGQRKSFYKFKPYDRTDDCPPRAGTDADDNTLRDE